MTETGKTMREIWYSERSWKCLQISSLRVLQSIITVATSTCYFL